MNKKIAICVKNDGYEASLEKRKIYEIIQDKEAENNNFVRIVDESGEDYLYSKDFFIYADLPICLSEVILAA